MTHNLHPDEFGVWSFLYSTFVVVAAFTVFGGHVLLAREYKIDSEDTVLINSVLSNSTVLFLFFNVAVFLFLLIKSPVPLENPGTIAIIMTLTALIQVLAFFLSSIFITQKKLVQNTICEFGPRAIGIALVSIATFFTSGFISFWFCYLLGAAMVLAWALKAVSSYMKFRKFYFSFSWKYMKQGFLITLIGTYFNINILIDNFFLLQFAGSEEVGFYRLAVTVSSLPLVFSNALTRNLIPLIREYLDNILSVVKLEKDILRHMLLVAAIMGGCLIITLLIGNNLIALFFGTEFTVALLPIILLLINHLLRLFFGPTDLILNLTYKEDKLLYVLMFGVVLNVLFNFLLVGEYGLNGCVVATLFSSLVIRFLLFRLTGRLTGIDSSMLSFLRRK